MKYSKGDKVKLKSRYNRGWEGWGFDKAIVVNPVPKISGAFQTYNIQANEGNGATMYVREDQIVLR